MRSMSCTQAESSGRGDGFVVGEGGWEAWVSIFSHYFKVPNDILCMLQGSPS